MTHTWKSGLGTRLLSIGAGALFLTAVTSAAHAAHYQVLTSTIAADLINSADGYCSLAEAVKSINDGVTVANCSDVNPADPGRISLVAAPNKPFATTHYVLNKQLNLNKAVLLTVAEEGLVAFIDSPGALAIKVNNGANVSLYGLEIKHTGTASGRLIWNAGTLSMASTTIRDGNVTTEPTGRGGGIYNELTGNLSLTTSKVLNNHATRGGGIYNDNGVIQYLDATISGNSATVAGGGVYNFRSGTNPNAVAILSSVIDHNSAKYGAGLANVGGQIFVYGATSITSNSTVAGTVTNNTTEICHKTTCVNTSTQNCSNGPCDGNGAGILNLDLDGTNFGNFHTAAPLTVSSNIALGYGGAIYSTGNLNLSNTTMDSNKAKSGAAIFAAALLDSAKNPYPNYCELLDTGGPSGMGFNTVTGTPANTKYSIVDSTGAFGTACAFRGVFAGGNSSPTCNPAGVRAENTCPQ